jgi:hypothetical protein
MASKSDNLFGFRHHSFLLTLNVLDVKVSRPKRKAFRLFARLFLAAELNRRRRRLPPNKARPDGRLGIMVLHAGFPWRFDLAVLLVGPEAD